MRSLYLLFLVLLIASSASGAVVGIMGDSALGDGIIDSASFWGSSFKEAAIGATLYTAGSGESVTELWIYTRGTSASAVCSLAVYTVASGLPDSLYSSVYAITTTNGTTTQWYSITGLSISLVSGEDYCIAVTSNGISVKRMLTAGTLGRRNSSAAGFTAVWAGGSSTNFELLLYAKVEDATASSSLSGRRRSILQGVTR